MRLTALVLLAASLPATPELVPAQRAARSSQQYAVAVNAATAAFFDRKLRGSGVRANGQ